MKNDNIHIFFAVLVANFEFASFAPKQKYMVAVIPWKWSVLQNPARERTNQSAWICLRLALPYNNTKYFLNEFKNNHFFKSVGLTHALLVGKKTVQELLPAFHEKITKHSLDFHKCILKI